MLNVKRFDSFGPNHRNILLAEDSASDVEIIKKKFSKDLYPHSLFVVPDGEDAMEFLHSQKTLPDVVILDINMPRMNGHEVLQSIRKDEKLTSLPVVMLTAINQSEDIERARNNRANGYFIKPNYCSLTELMPILDMLKLSPSIFVQIEE